LEPLLRKIEVFNKQFFNAFQRAHNPSTSLFKSKPNASLAEAQSSRRKAKDLG
jgi:hypothetical protein